MCLDDQIAQVEAGIATIERKVGTIMSAEVTARAGWRPGGGSIISWATKESEWVSSFLTAHQHIVDYFSALLSIRRTRNRMMVPDDIP